MRKTDAAWLAGLFEGEGTAYASKKTKAKPRSSIRAVIAMTDRDVVHRIAQATGLGRICQQELPSGKISYRWTVAGAKDFRKFMDWILPWLGERRTKQLNRVWRAWETNPPKQGGGLAFQMFGKKVRDLTRTEYNQFQKEYRRHHGRADRR